MKRVPRLLLVAFALSLLVHLIFALILHPPTPTPENQAEVVSIEHRPASIAVTKMPTPPPPPKADARARIRSSARPARKGPGHARTAPGGTGTAAPTPHRRAPTPQPTACAKRGCAQAEYRGGRRRNAGRRPISPPDARASGDQRRRRS